MNPYYCSQVKNDIFFHELSTTIAALISVSQMCAFNALHRVSLSEDKNKRKAFKGAVKDSILKSGPHILSLTAFFFQRCFCFVFFNSLSVWSRDRK